MSVKNIFQSLLLVVSCFLVVSCSDANSDKDLMTVEIKQTRLHAGSNMQMDYHINGELKINQLVSITLVFQLEPYQLIELEFHNNEDFEWLRVLEASHQADEAGVVKVEIYITPVAAGKTYIKFIAASVDGTSIGSFSIPLAVIDVNNELPIKSKKALDRINLPATPR